MDIHTCFRQLVELRLDVPCFFGCSWRCRNAEGSRPFCIETSFCGTSFDDNRSGASGEWISSTTSGTEGCPVNAGDASAPGEVIWVYTLAPNAEGDMVLDSSVLRNIFSSNGHIPDTVGALFVRISLPD